MILPRPRALHAIDGHGGVTLAVAEYGRPDARPVVLIHGFSQAGLSWARQLSGPLAEYRLIVPDMRGHGFSGKPPATAENYTRSEPYAGDIAAIVAALDLDRPVLAGWSMGGIWTCDYLRVHGDTSVSGYALIGSFSATGKYSPPEALAARNADPAVRATGILSCDLAENLDATEAFIAACFATPPAPSDKARILAFNMLCPPEARAVIRPREEDFRATLAALSVPALILHGARDRIVPRAYADQTAAALPDATCLVYDDSGHCPFWEEADRFNTDLAAFAARCFEARP